MRREATCSCGALRALCSGEPDIVSVCHCLACQKRTGSTHGIGAFFQASQVTIEGASKGFERQTESGLGLEFRFCPDCGSTVYWESRRKPGMIAVAVGAFADPGFPAPDREVYTDSRHAWIAPLDA